VKKGIRFIPDAFSSEENEGDRKEELA